jgi:radical SAM protein with 4Fe4S-binding SPASM domain
MHCAERKWLSTNEYLTQFITICRQRRIPLAGSLEMTRRCNLRCVHCYLGPQAERRKPGSGEMSTMRILDIIDEITAAGCLYLLLTGGEPLLRDDFSVIYRHAKERGLLVTVFSNGTLITEKVLALFRDLPPHEVEISLYGATAATYEKITGVRGSYEECMRGIKLLADSKIKVNLKTILMTLNSDELFEMETIAKEFGARFRFDAAISPCVGGDKTPLALRVSPEDAIDMEFSNRDRLRQWKVFFEESKRHILVDTLYGCGAGVTGFHVSASGHLQPCVMTFDVQYNLSEMPFLKGWDDMISRLREKRAGPDFACIGCEKINLCGYCPAFFRLENGAEDVRSEYICRMGNLRYQRITDHCSGGDDYDSEAGKSIQKTL